MYVIWLPLIVWAKLGQNRFLYSVCCFFKNMWLRRWCPRMACSCSRYGRSACKMSVYIDQKFFNSTYKVMLIVCTLDTRSVNLHNCRCFITKPRCHLRCSSCGGVEFIFPCCGPRWLATVAAPATVGFTHITKVACVVSKVFLDHTTIVER